MPRFSQGRGGVALHIQSVVWMAEGRGAELAAQGACIFREAGGGAALYTQSVVRTGEDRGARKLAMQGACVFREAGVE